MVRGFTLRTLPPGVNAVVSLCRVHNGDLDFVLTDTVRLIEQLRNEGRSVLLHCVACQSRTPTVAALYGARKQGISGVLALREITRVLPNAWPNSDFQKAIERLAP